MTFEFDLIPERAPLIFAEGAWDKARFWLLEFQLAKRVSLIGDPPSRIRVVSHGDQPDVAPGVLARLEALAGTAFRVEMR